MGENSIFYGSRNIFVGAAGRKEAAYRGPPDVGLLTCTSIIFKYLQYQEDILDVPEYQQVVLDIPENQKMFLIFKMFRILLT